MRIYRFTPFFYSQQTWLGRKKGSDWRIITAITGGKRRDSWLWIISHYSNPNMNFNHAGIAEARGSNTGWEGHRIACKWRCSFILAVVPGYLFPHFILEDFLVLKHFLCQFHVDHGTGKIPISYRIGHRAHGVAIIPASKYAFHCCFLKFICFYVPLGCDFTT